MEQKGNIYTNIIANYGVQEMIESNDLEGLLRDYFCYNSSRIIIISPFITNSVLESILPYDSGDNVTIITSWRAEHLQSGVSNIELYQLAKERKWNLYINDYLHLKLYSNNYDDCYIGSANVTRKGLGDYTNSNIEGLYKIEEMNTRDNLLIEIIILSSNLVTEELYQRYHEWFQNIEIQETNYELPPIILENKDDDSDVNQDNAQEWSESMTASVQSASSLIKKGVRLIAEKATGGTPGQGD